MLDIIKFSGIWPWALVLGFAWVPGWVREMAYDILPLSCGYSRGLDQVKIFLIISVALTPRAEAGEQRSLTRCPSAR
jgi:hypothetical protein